MIKLKRGPVIDRYAEMYDVPPDEVVDWMNDYINFPEHWESLAEIGMYEATEAERAESIKAYLKREAEPYVKAAA